MQMNGRCTGEGPDGWVPSNFLSPRIVKRLFFPLHNLFIGFIEQEIYSESMHCASQRQLNLYVYVLLNSLKTKGPNPLRTYSCGLHDPLL